MRIHFYVRFSTQHGQSLSLLELSNNKNGEEQAVFPMEYLNNEFWQTSRIIQNKSNFFHYKYILTDKDGSEIIEWDSDRKIELSDDSIHEISVIDTWNHAGDFENVFFTAPFQNVLLKHNPKIKSRASKDFTHIFRVKAPLLSKNEVICLVGNNEALHNWSSEPPVILTKQGNWWTIKMHISKKDFPVAYKYGVYNVKEKHFIRFEFGNNRFLYVEGGKRKIILIHDGFVHLPNNTWKGAGVTIPVFSLRSKNGFGIGEFADLKLLVDWAKSTGLKLIQLLPINDTTVDFSWTDSYPYAAISAFALHPIYINLEKLTGKKHTDIIRSLKKKQKELNQLPDVDYEQVLKFKWEALKQLFQSLKKETFDSDEYKNFFEDNRHWLLSYAAFCYLRDKYGSSYFEKWKTNSLYDKVEIEKLTSPKSKSHDHIAFYYFVQYHLHLQLKEASDYAHKNGVIIKGDIPIGVYRYGCDTWVAPELYNLDKQAGAPPDDFAIKGQNWGFPTYNWKKMQEDGFAWWKQRFSQMSNYFDAFRIDHILGFFRIWSIPQHAIEGIMGYFIPAISIHINEFGEKGIWFENERYCKPYITNEILWNIFGNNNEKVMREFIDTNERGEYKLKETFKTQRQVDNYFKSLEENEENTKLKFGLFDLISNIILFEEEGSNGQRFHFRIHMEKTYSFQYLDWQVQQKLRELYVDYFFKRQDDFWMKEAMNKLPPLKSATNMLVCGEDLGMVPHCVSEVMKQLGILSLEIQRMPKDPNREFFHPNDAPYLSVITPSTHDMSTIRGWWEEDRSKTQRYFNYLMGQWGDPPYFCEAWINRAIVMQHLYSPAMWSIFLIQDILGMSETLRRKNPHEERINVPANPRHYWKYRMHILLEELIKQKDFNHEVKEYVVNSGR